MTATRERKKAEGEEQKQWKDAAGQEGKVH